MLKKELNELVTKESEFQQNIKLSKKEIQDKIKKLLEEYTEKYGLKVKEISGYYNYVSEIRVNTLLVFRNKYIVSLKIEGEK